MGQIVQPPLLESLKGQLQEMWTLELLLSWPHLLNALRLLVLPPLLLEQLRGPCHLPPP